MTTDPLAVLLDPENAPAVHGSWHRPMGEESVILDDDDGCSLFVEPGEVAVLVNRAVAARTPASPETALREAAQAVVDNAEVLGETQFLVPIEEFVALRRALTTEEAQHEYGPVPSCRPRRRSRPQRGLDVDALARALHAGGIGPSSVDGHWLCQGTEHHTSDATFIAATYKEATDD